MFDDMTGRKVICLLIMLIFLVPGSLLNLPHNTMKTPVQPVTQVNPQYPTLVFLTPSNVSDLARTTGTVTFGINVTRSPAISVFLVSLRYRSIQASNATLAISSTGIDPTGNVLGPLDGTTECQNAPAGSCTFPFRFCIDGTAIGGGQCLENIDEQGVITYGLYTLGNKTSSQITSGSLFKVTFNIVGKGFVQLQLVQVVLGNGVGVASGGSAGTIGQQINTSTEDGFFTNMDCPAGSRIPCKPMILGFNVSPSPPSFRHAANFTATVNDLNRNAGIVKYTWSWGDTTPDTDQTHTSYPRIGQPEQHAFTQREGSYHVSLYVLDNETVSWGVTQIVNVVAVFIDVTVVGLTVSPQFNVYPGTVVSVSASVYNNSTLPETGNLTITFEGKSLGPSAFGSFKLDGRGGNGPNTGTLSSVSLNTTGLSPRVYRIEATAAPVKDENITSSHVAYAFIQLVEPRPAGLFSLSLLQTSTLGIVIVVGVAFAAARLFKRPSYESEPL